jgi:hypothetical protein
MASVPPIVWVPPAVEEPVIVELVEVVMLEVVRPFTMMVWPGVAPEAISAVIQK